MKQTKVMNIETTEDCLQAAELLKSEAGKIVNLHQRDQFNKKAEEVMDIIKDALETGFFTGSAHKELKEAQKIIYSDCSEIMKSNILGGAK